jgi:Flp pilus assembly protein TadG
MKTENNNQQKAYGFTRRIKRFFRTGGEEGNALLEFAVTLPLFLTVLTGTASFSLALYFLQQIGNATSTASQLLGAEAGLITDPCASAVTSVTASLPNLTASKITYTVAITDSGGTAHTYGPTAGSSFTCLAGAAQMAANEPVTVTVKYNYTWLPILAFSPSSNLISSETALAE